MSYQIIDEKIIGNKISSSGDFMQIKVVHIVCDSSASIPEPRPEWSAGSRCDVLADSGTVYILSISGEWKQVNFYNRGGEGGGFDPDAYYTKPQIDTKFAEKVDKITGKGLSTNDYTTEEKTKLSGIEGGAERNVQSDWNQATITEDDFIKNKPILVGKNVEGETYDVDGTSYTASEGAEIFNSYTYNKAIGEYSHSEGDGTIALGAGAHSEGGLTKAKGDHSHTEGYGTIADGDYNHAEGYYTTTYSMCSHAEGYETTASGTCSHSQGVHTVASGRNSHAEGAGTIAAGGMSHAQGKWNKSDTSGKYAFIIGNGTDDLHRSDAFAVGWNGLIYQNNSETGVDLNNKVDKVSGKGLSTNDYTTEEKTKLSGIEAGANKTVVDFALNSSSTNPVQNKVIKESLDNKVDKVTGKGLSTNDFTNADKTKLSGIEEGATKTIVDTDLSSTSTNPVQNKAVKAALDSKADAAAMSVVGLRLVASDVLTSNTAYTYQMSKNDFDKSELGTYIISIVTWSTTPKYSLYAVSYTGNTVFRNLIVKIAGDDMTVTVEDAVISASGFPSNGGKISIHALQ